MAGGQFSAGGDISQVAALVVLTRTELYVAYNGSETRTCSRPNADAQGATPHSKAAPEDSLLLGVVPPEGPTQQWREHSGAYLSTRAHRSRGRARRGNLLEQLLGAVLGRT